MWNTDDEQAVPPDRLPAGTRVEVQDRFDFAFCPGFEVAAPTAHGYRVRRVSDGIELPAEFPPETVRAVPASNFR
jgi:hypothetical protein